MEKVHNISKKWIYKYIYIYIYINYKKAIKEISIWNAYFAKISR